MFLTMQKGAVGLTFVIADLVQRGYEIFTPYTEQTSCDLIAVKDGAVYKLQVKYREAKSNGTKSFSIHNRKGYTKSVNGPTVYSKTDFDMYAVYVPGVPVGNVYYFPFELGGKDIVTALPKIDREFYWGEDFKEFPPTQNPVKRSITEFQSTDTSSG